MSVNCAREKTIVVSAQDSIVEAARLMAQHSVGCVVVARAAGGARVPIGIVTDRDIAVRAVASGLDSATRKVERIMSSDLLLAREEDDLDVVLRLMRGRGVRRAPIVNERHELVGILAYDDAVEWVTGELAGLSRLIQRERVHDRERWRRCQASIECEIATHEVNR